jgi:protein-disulfide isomerase
MFNLKNAKDYRFSFLTVTPVTLRPAAKKYLNFKQLIMISSFIFFVSLLMITFVKIHKADAIGGALSQKSIKTVINNQREQGNPNANVTIVEYSDFQCPWCGKFEKKDLPLIYNKYIKTGKVFIIYRDFPLTPMHKYAFKAAQYADCSALQGKYIYIRSLLYKYQSKWSVIGDIYYFLHKKTHGELNMKKEQACVKNGLTIGLIKENMNKGGMLGVTGVPTLFIYKGLKLVDTIRGYEPFNELNQTLKIFVK